MFLCFEINGQTLKRSKKNKILSGTENYYECKFTTCSNWYDLKKTVLFISRNNQVYSVDAVPYPENKHIFTCKVPTEVLNETFKITVVGYGDDSRITTNPLTIQVTQSGFSVETIQSIESRSYWSLFQINGERTDYSGAFFNCFLRELFKPIYNIKPVCADYMFMQSKLYYDLQELLNEQNIILDTSKCESMTRMFYKSAFAAIGELNCEKVNDLAETFAYCDNLERISKLKVSEHCMFSDTFLGLSSLQEITIEGIIANDIDFSDCINLSADSVQNIIQSLSDNVTGCTIKFPAVAADRVENFETISGNKTKWIFELEG